MAEESKGDAEATLDKNSAATEDASEQFKNIKMATILSGEKNARGIPYVAFIDSVEGTLATTTDGTVEKLIGAMNELHQKFKILEGHKARTKASMKLKIPEIKRTLQLVRHIKEKHEASEDFGAHYSLSEMLYGRAKVTPDGTVCLWLGANVMVEYPYDEVRISASRGAAVPSLHSNASSPGMMDVGGLFFEFEAIRTRDAPRRASWRSSIGYYVLLRRTP